MEMIDRYRITGRIGSGSFATVYQGHDDTLDVAVAIKVLAENWSTNDDVRGRFLAEARLLRRLSDERIVRVYDIGTTDRGQPYYVMDIANGGSLDQLRKRRVQPGLALRLCAEATRALEVLHKHQLVHRDITPGNVLLNNTKSGVKVLLADLGVAKSLLDEYRDTMTAGTPAYMALEQAKSTQLDQRSDLYSMGCVTYALLTGHPPFPIKTLEDLLSRNSAIGPVPIAEQIGAPASLDTFFA
uniref:serine/threonine-protein kinase n=1 Tax=uncultured Tessaracoccus sp. TaxID=905023 RepID=UPI0026343329